MKRKSAISFILISILTLISLTLLILNTRKPGSLTSAEPTYTIPRQVQYSYTLKNTTNRVITIAELWVYGPVKQTATQKSISVKTTPPHTLINDQLGNQILHFTFDSIPPYGTRTVSIQADLLLNNTPNMLPNQDMDNFIKPTPFVESDHPSIQSKADELKKTDPAETVTSIFRWVHGHIQYAGYLSRNRGALYALRHRKGDCTEFANLFAAVCRAQQVPVRTLGGYIAKSNAILKAQAYHNWAEFMEEGKWKIADPQNKVLRENASDYIAMRIIGATSQNPMEAHHRFRVKGDGLKVKMN